MGVVAIYKLWELGLLRPFLSKIEKILVTEQEYNDLKSLGEKQLISIREIEHLVNAKSIEIIQSPKEAKVPPSRRRRQEGGEMEGVAMYDAVKARFIISEDDYMRVHSQDLGINMLSLPDVIWYMVKKRAISKEQAEEALDKLKMEGWYTEKVIDYVKRNLNHKFPPFTGTQLEKFLRLAEQYDKIEISLSAAASQLGVTPVEFLEHFISSGHMLKYSVEDFRNSRKLLYVFLRDDYPPPKK